MHAARIEHTLIFVSNTYTITIVILYLN